MGEFRYFLENLKTLEWKNYYWIESYGDTTGLDFDPFEESYPNMVLRASEESSETL